MNNLKNENQDFVSVIDYHFNRLVVDLERAKFDNNQNDNLIRFFESILCRLELIKELIVKDPRPYFNSIFSEMKRLHEEMSGELDGVNVIIPYKENPDPGRMGYIVMKKEMDKNILEDGEQVS